MSFLFLLGLIRPKGFNLSPFWSVEVHAALYKAVQAELENPFPFLNKGTKSTFADPGRRRCGPRPRIRCKDLMANLLCLLA